jgi:CBS domain containing-hemolysin-like protein
LPTDLLVVPTFGPVLRLIGPRRDKVLDTDSLPSALVFSAFLFLFVYLSLAHHANASLLGRTTPRTESIISWLKYACVIAAALSGLSLVHSTGIFGWWPVSFLALALLVFLVVVDRAAASKLGRQARSTSRWVTALRRLVPGIRERGFSAEGHGDNEDSGESDLSGDTLPHRREPDFTAADLISLDQRDREMLRSILRLDVITAREIMVPRLDMLAVEADAGLTQVCQLMVQGGHSRLPVYEDTIDSILGIIHSRDVMEVMAGQNSLSSIRDLVRPAFIIPETKRIDDLLEELQDKGIQMAVVVDEYGGTEGLVTMEDVLEEIVGEIEDEFSRTREAEIIRLPDGAVLVDARVTTDDVDEIFGTRIDSTDVDTVGGYVYHSLGKIPQLGDVVVTDHLHIEVVSILGRRLRKLRIQRLDNNDSDSTGH